MEKEPGGANYDSTNMYGIEGAYTAMLTVTDELWGNWNCECERSQSSGMRRHAGKPGCGNHIAHIQQQIYPQ